MWLLVDWLIVDHWLFIAIVICRFYGGSHLVMRFAVLVHSDPLLLLFDWLLILDDLRLLLLVFAIPEVVMFHNGRFLYLVHDGAVLVAVFLACEVRLVRRVDVQVGLVTFVLVPVVLLFVVLEVLVEHAAMSVLLFLDVSRHFVLRVGGLLDVVLNVMLLLVGDAVLYAESGDLLLAQSLLLGLRGGLWLFGHGHSGHHTILAVKLFGTPAQVSGAVEARLLRLRNGLLLRLMLGSWRSVVLLLFLRLIRLRRHGFAVIFGGDMAASVNIDLPVFVVIILVSLRRDVAASIHVNIPVSSGSIRQLNEFLINSCSCRDRFWCRSSSWSGSRRIWVRCWRRRGRRIGMGYGKWGWSDSWIRFRCWSWRWCWLGLRSWGWLNRFQRLFLRFGLRFFLWFSRLGLFELLAECVSDELVLREHIEGHLSGSVVRVLRKVPIARPEILILRVVALHMVSGVVPGVLVMVNTRVLIQVIIVGVGHRIVVVIEGSLVALVLALLSDHFELLLLGSYALSPLHFRLQLLRLLYCLFVLLGLVISLRVALLWLFLLLSLRLLCMAWLWFSSRTFFRLLLIAAACLSSVLEVVLNVLILHSNPLALLLPLRCFLRLFLLLLRLFLLLGLLLVPQLLSLGRLPVMLPLAVLLVGHVGLLRLLSGSRLLVVTLTLRVVCVVSAFLSMLGFAVVALLFDVGTGFRLLLVALSLALLLISLPFGFRIRVFILGFLICVQILVVAPSALSLAVSVGELDFRLVSLVMVFGVVMLGLVVNHRCLVVVWLLVSVVLVARVRSVLIHG